MPSPLSGFRGSCAKINTGRQLQDSRSPPQHCQFLWVIGRLGAVAPSCSWDNSSGNSQKRRQQAAWPRIASTTPTCSRGTPKRRITCSDEVSHCYVSSVSCALRTEGLSVSEEQDILDPTSERAATHRGTYTLACPSETKNHRLALHHHRRTFEVRTTASMVPSRRLARILAAEIFVLNSGSRPSSKK